MNALRCLIVISGGRGSGKTTFAKSLAQELSLPYAGFGETVRDYAASQGLSDSRETLQTMGEKMVAEMPEEFCYLVLKRLNHQPDHAAILEGVRHVEILQVLRKVVAPQTVFHIHLDSTDVVRIARLKSRNRQGDTLSTVADNHSTEIQLKGQLPAVADAVLDGGLAVQELIQAILPLLPVVSPQDGA